MLLYCNRFNILWQLAQYIQASALFVVFSWSLSNLLSKGILSHPEDTKSLLA